MFAFTYEAGEFYPGWVLKTPRSGGGQAVILQDDNFIPLSRRFPPSVGEGNRIIKAALDVIPTSRDTLPALVLISQSRRRREDEQVGIHFCEDGVVTGHAGQFEAVSWTTRSSEKKTAFNARSIILVLFDRAVAKFERNGSAFALMNRNHGEITCLPWSDYLNRSTLVQSSRGTTVIEEAAEKALSEIPAEVGQARIAAFQRRLSMARQTQASA